MNNDLESKERCFYSWKVYGPRRKKEDGGAVSLWSVEKVEGDSEEGGGPSVKSQRQISLSL